MRVYIAGFVYIISVPNAIVRTALEHNKFPLFIFQAELDFRSLQRGAQVKQY